MEYALVSSGPSGQMNDWAEFRRLIVSLSRSTSTIILPNLSSNIYLLLASLYFPTGTGTCSIRVDSTFLGIVAPAGLVTCLGSQVATH